MRRMNLIDAPILSPMWPPIFQPIWRNAGAALTALGLALVLALGSGCGGDDKKVNEPDKTSDADDGGDRSGDHRASAPDIGDEEDDDDVQIAGLKGRLDPYDIKKGIEPHQDALVACFTDKVGRRKYLGGSVEFQFVVNPDGTVKTAHMLRSDLGNWTMEKCMLDVCQAMTFAKPQGRAEADFTLPLGFDARRAVAVWDDARVQEVVTEEQVATIAACAEETSTDNPSGVWFTIYVGSRGKVLSVGMAAPDGPIDATWAQCAHDKVKAWELVDPRGRAKFSYQYNP